MRPVRSFSLDELRRRLEAAKSKKLRLAAALAGCRLATAILWGSLIGATGLLVWRTENWTAGEGFGQALFELAVGLASMTAFAWLWIRMDDARASMASELEYAGSIADIHIEGLRTQIDSRAAERTALADAKALASAVKAAPKSNRDGRI